VIKQSPATEIKVAFGLSRCRRLSKDNVLENNDVPFEFRNLSGTPNLILTTGSKTLNISQRFGIAWAPQAPE
jgi:hypothetical protein